MFGTHLKYLYIMNSPVREILDMDFDACSLAEELRVRKNRNRKNIQSLKEIGQEIVGSLTSEGDNVSGESLLNYENAFRKSANELQTHLKAAEDCKVQENKVLQDIEETVKKIRELDTQILKFEEEKESVKNCKRLEEAYMKGLLPYLTNFNFKVDITHYTETSYLAVINLIVKSKEYPVQIKVEHKKLLVDFEASFISPDLKEELKCKCIENGGGIPALIFYLRNFILSKH